MRNLEAVIHKRVMEYGAKFNADDLAPLFIPFFESKERIKVRMGTPGMAYEPEVLTGTVGITTGWVPAFLLMRRSDSTGSPFVLAPHHQILAVQRGRGGYVPLENLPGWAPDALECPLNRCPFPYYDMADLHYHLEWHRDEAVREAWQKLGVRA